MAERARQDYHHVQNHIQHVSTWYEQVLYNFPILSLTAYLDNRDAEMLDCFCNEDEERSTGAYAQVQLCDSDIRIYVQRQSLTRICQIPKRIMTHDLIGFKPLIDSSQECY